MIPAESELKITTLQIEQKLRDFNITLWTKTQEYEELVKKRAEDEYNWRVGHARKLLDLTDHPVTVRQDLVKGDKDVAKLKMKYEISLGIERACLESIKDLREKIAVFRSFLSFKKQEIYSQ